jgi:hypothetical protein
MRSKRMRSKKGKSKVDKIKRKRRSNINSRTKMKKKRSRKTRVNRRSFIRKTKRRMRGGANWRDGLLYYMITNEKYESNPIVTQAIDGLIKGVLISDLAKNMKSQLDNIDYNILLEYHESMKPQQRENTGESVEEQLRKLPIVEKKRKEEEDKKEDKLLEGAESSMEGTAGSDY